MGLCRRARFPQGVPLALLDSIVPARSIWMVLIVRNSPMHLTLLKRTGLVHLAYALVGAHPMRVAP